METITDGTLAPRSDLQEKNEKGEDVVPYVKKFDDTTLVVKVIKGTTHDIVGKTLQHPASIPVAGKFCLSGAPTELQQQILRAVLADPNKAQGLESLNAVQLTSKHLRALFLGDQLLKATHNAHQRILKAVDGLHIVDLMQHVGTLLAWASSNQKEA